MATAVRLGSFSREVQFRLRRYSSSFGVSTRSQLKSATRRQPASYRRKTSLASLNDRRSGFRPAPLDPVGHDLLRGRMFRGNEVLDLELVDRLQRFVIQLDI